MGQALNKLAGDIAERVKTIDTNNLLSFSLILSFCNCCVVFITLVRLKIVSIIFFVTLTRLKLWSSLKSIFYV